MTGNRRHIKKPAFFQKIAVTGLLLLLLLNTFFGRGGGLLPKREVQAAGYKVNLSRILTDNKISELDRSSSEGLWKLSVGGKESFCLNSGKSMCSGDTVQDKTYYGATYSRPAIAKALTYYYRTLGGNAGTKKFALVQAYIWACGKGVSKQTTVYQAGRNVDKSFSSQDAKKFCERISDTDPEGTIHYNTVTKCVRGKRHSAHQVLYGWSKQNPKVETAKITAKDQAEGRETVSLQVFKKDVSTGTGLSGAVFQVQCDGKQMGTIISEADGKAGYTYERKYNTSDYSSTKNYIKNWKELAVSQQKTYTGNGYYASKAKALAAANAEVREKANAQLENLKKINHTWTITESKAPFGHFLSGTAKTAVERPGAKSFQFTFYNEEKFMDLELCKKSSEEDYGVEATLNGAVYGVYAAEKIFRSDLKTVAHQAGDLVTKVVTNAGGYGKVSGLLPGTYYLQELVPPKGFEKNTVQTKADVSNANQSVTVKDHVIHGKIKLKKTFGGEHLEELAEFDVYNAENQKVDTMITDKRGMAESKDLPYGNYRIHQTKGIEGYSEIPDIMIAIDGSQEDAVYEVSADDEPRHAAIALTKTLRIDDDETGTYLKKAESGAQFQILNEEKEVIENLETDLYGVAKSGELKPGTYTVHQTKGTKNFALAEDFQVTIREGEHDFREYKLEDPYNGSKLRIQKTKTKNKTTTPETEAEFMILDKAFCKEIGTTDLSTEEKRVEYIAALNQKAVLGEILTDREGKGVLLLNDFTGEDGFVVLQTKGEEGYQLSKPYDSDQHKPKKEEGISVYTFSADDLFDDYGSIKIHKKIATTAADTKAEEGAKFEILNVQGKVVDTLTTDQNGEDISIPLSFGLYTVHQIEGSKKHEFMKDQEVVITKEYKHKVMTVDGVDEEKPVTFYLTKKSFETKKLQNGAVYEIYKKSGELVTKLVTGSETEGRASFQLPFGEYVMKEAAAPDGYQKNTEERSFTLDLSSVNYDDQGNGTYEMTEEDTPIYGEISLKKKGEILTGYSKSEQGFVYETAALSGAVYGLYAKEDIKKDDGSVVWRAGTKIDEKATDGEGRIVFTRNKADGTETKDFYLGTYYVKEIRAPYGYTADPEEHEVILTWDIKPEALNDIRPVQEVPDQEDPFGNNTPYPNGGIYVLEEGSKLNQKLRDAKTITFTWKEAPKTAVLTDVSANGDGSVVLWKDGEDYIISSQKAGQVIYMNTVSDHLFARCGNLIAVYFKNIDTSGVIDASYMFYQDEKLKDLDLSSFHTANVEDMTKMFYACTSLKTIYTPDQKLIKEEETYQEAEPVYIEALPKHEFMLGDPLKAEDFVWRYTYDDDGETKVTVTDGDVEFSPASANKTGEQKVQISFRSASAFAKYQTIETTIDVVDPREEKPVLNTVKKAAAHLEFSDGLQKYSIHVIKKDQDGKILEGAAFALKAACEIVNHKGETIVQKGDTIAAAISPDDQFGYMEFFGLPTDLFAKGGKGSDLFTVEETIPPDGYKPSDQILTFKGEVLNQESQSFVHDAVSEGNVSSNLVTFLHDSDEFVNTKLEYISLKKVWEDHNDQEGRRPASMKVTAVRTDTGAKTEYILNADNNWTAVTNIRQEEKEKYRFSETCDSTAYEQIGKTGGNWNKENGVISFTNRYKSLFDKVNITAEKKWEDADNQDGIRPASVTVKLYVDGKDTKLDQTLNAGNNWTADWNDMNVKDSVGEDYEYEVREVPGGKINGDAKKGYETSYDFEVSTDAITGEKTMAWTITNTHKTENVKKSIRKVWKDGEDQDEIRPTSVQVKFLADGQVQGTYTLSDQNGWSVETGILPVYKNGSKVQYTWEEEERGWITGEPVIGYQPAYAEDINDSSLTILTNTHDPDAPKGKVTLYKEIDPSNLPNIRDFTFTMKLTGMDVYGRTFVETKDVTFLSDDIKTYQKEHPGEKMKHSVTFDGLNYGTYVAEEYGEEKYFKLGNITSGSTNVQMIKENQVQIEIGPENPGHTQSLTAKAVFFNRLREGSITLRKVNDSGAVISGAKFTLRGEDGTVLEQKESGKDGSLIFEHLKPATYSVTEIKTQGGYSLLKKPFKVTIPLMIGQAEAEEQRADTKDAVKIGGRYYFYNVAFEVRNGEKLKLPMTGGENNGRWYFFISLGVVMLSGVFLKRKGE